MVPSFRFPKKFHLRKSSEFQKVYSQKQRLASSIIRIYWIQNDLSYTRMGLSVSKKNGNAVRRNRIKRLFREAFRLTRPDMANGYDLVMIPTFKEEIPSFMEIQKSLKVLVQQIK